MGSLPDRSILQQKPMHEDRDRDAEEGFGAPRRDYGDWLVNGISANFNQGWHLDDWFRLFTRPVQALWGPMQAVLI